MSWAVEGKQVRTPIGKVVSFDFPIKEALEVGEVSVVVLDVPPDEVMTENAFCVSKDGKVLWQIERIPETSTDPVNVYVGVSQGESPETVRIANWNGDVATVDVQTGRVVQTRWLK